MLGHHKHVQIIVSAALAEELGIAPGTVAQFRPDLNDAIARGDASIPGYVITADGAHHRTTLTPADVAPGVSTAS